MRNEESAVDAAISVVLLAPTGREGVARTLWHLRRQTIAAQMELLLVGISGTDSAVYAEDFAPFAQARFLPVASLSNMAAARALAARQAIAPVVAFSEDHCFPEPQWAERLIAAHALGYAVVGPRMLNENPHSLWSWAAFAMHFGHCGTDLEGPTRYTATHNTSFLRDALQALEDDLEPLAEMELMLQDRLRSMGYRVYQAAEARTWHVNVSRALPLLHSCIYGGWLFATVRADEQRWSALRKMRHLLLSPAIPLLQVKRRWPLLKQLGADRQLVPAVLFPMLVISAFHTLGEMWGLLFPDRNTVIYYSQFEHTRCRFVRQKERVLLMER